MIDADKLSCKARLAHSRVVEEAEKKNMQLRESRSARLHVCVLASGIVSWGVRAVQSVTSIV